MGKIIFSHKEEILLDEVAAKVLQSIVLRGKVFTEQRRQPEGTFEEVAARQAYEFASAMVLERRRLHNQQEEANAATPE